jgi:hypothetical protein
MQPSSHGIAPVSVEPPVSVELESAAVSELDASVDVVLPDVELPSADEEESAPDVVEEVVDDEVEPLLASVPPDDAPPSVESPHAANASQGASSMRVRRSLMGCSTLPRSPCRRRRVVVAGLVCARGTPRLVAESECDRKVAFAQEAHRRCTGVSRPCGPM